MANQVKRTISISPESDYEIHQLAAKWCIPVAKARERCYHYAASSALDATFEEALAKDIAEIRQAEARVEMLKSSGPRRQ